MRNLSDFINQKAYHPYTTKQSWDSFPAYVATHCRSRYSAYDLIIKTEMGALIVQVAKHEQHASTCTYIV